MIANELLSNMLNVLSIDQAETIAEKEKEILNQIQLLHSVEFAANELLSKLHSANDDLFLEMLDDLCAPDIINLSKALERASANRQHR